MKIIADPGHALAQGLASIREQYKVPLAFPDGVLAAAEVAARRTPAKHVDRTTMPFVTLDPAQSTDLDQAFNISRSGADLLLHYAIADIAWFVDDGDALDTEAWKRGTTLYLPDGKARLYPPVLSEGVASLLPSGPRPAVIFTVRVNEDGGVKLDGAERAIIHSRAKLAYDSVRDADLPEDFVTFAERIQAAEDRRGAARVDPPEQEVSKTGDGQYELVFRPRLLSEARNAAMSLAANMAIADALQAHHTGLFRIMAEPDEAAVQRLRYTARGFGLAWAETETLTQFVKSLSAADPRQAAFMLAARRAGKGATYVPYREGAIPWHAAMGATYAHATAPLRRLADRYVIRATLAIANGQAVPDAVTDAFGRLPATMSRADATGGQVERAVVDLAESVMLQSSVGKHFPAIVTDVDERGVRIQLRDLPVVSRVAAANVRPGDALDVILTSADPLQRAAIFEAAR